MKSIKQQIIEAKKEKTEREEELWFVDYCNNCKPLVNYPFFH